MIFYLVFPRNNRMVFLPHTKTVILLELYCGTITELGLPVIKAENLCTRKTSPPIDHCSRFFYVEIHLRTLTGIVELFRESLKQKRRWGTKSIF